MTEWFIKYNRVAPAFLTAAEQQPRVIHSLYAMSYHQAMALKDVRQEAARLSVECPLLRLFTDFLPALRGPGIIR